MNIYKTRTFTKWQDKENITDEDLCIAIQEIHKGLIDANLGNGLIKKRIARSGASKSSGYRTLLATNKNDRWFFIYGFAKNDRANISKSEEKALKQLVKDLLLLAKVEINIAIKEGELKEIINE